MGPPHEGSIRLLVSNADRTINKNSGRASGGGGGMGGNFELQMYFYYTNIYLGAHIYLAPGDNTLCSATEQKCVKRVIKYSCHMLINKLVNLWKMLM